MVIAGSGCCLTNPHESRGVKQQLCYDIWDAVGLNLARAQGAACLLHGIEGLPWEDPGDGTWWWGWGGDGGGLPPQKAHSLRSGSRAARSPTSRTADGTTPTRPLRVAWLPHTRVASGHHARWLRVSNKSVCSFQQGGRFSTPSGPTSESLDYKQVTRGKECQAQRPHFWVEGSSRPPCGRP